ncbi:hypothetical protein RB595_002924 [Gaeumannomyces hyphopodioides]
MSAPTASTYTYDLVYIRTPAPRRWFARKQVSRGHSTQAEEQDLFVELASLRALRHQHVARIAGSYTDLASVAYLMEPVSELSLETYLNLKSSFDQGNRRFVQQFFGCLAGAVSYMHRPGIGIRHLSTRNIFVSSQYRLFLSGFGATAQHPPEAEYAAPESGDQGQDHLASDMWDLGVVFLKTTVWLLGAPPSVFPRWLDSESTEAGLRPQLWKHKDDILGWVEARASPKSPYAGRYQKLVPLVSGLLQSSPHQRPAAHEVAGEVLSWEDWSEFCCAECYGESQTSDHESTQLWADPVPLRTLAWGHAPRGMEASASTPQAADHPWALQSGGIHGANSSNDLLPQLPTRASPSGPLTGAQPAFPQYGQHAIQSPTRLSSTAPLDTTWTGCVPGYGGNMTSAFPQHANQLPFETSRITLEYHAGYGNPSPVFSPTEAYDSDSITDASSERGSFCYGATSALKSTPATSFSTLAESLNGPAYYAPEYPQEKATPYDDIGLDSNQWQSPPSQQPPPPPPPPVQASRNNLPATFSATSTRTTQPSTSGRSHRPNDTSNTKQAGWLPLPLMVCAPDATITKSLIDCCANARSRPLTPLLEEAVRRGLARSCRKALLRAVAGASGRHNQCVRVVLDRLDDAADVVNRVDGARGKTALGLAVEHPDFDGYDKLARLLLDHGADPNIPDRRGVYPVTGLLLSALGAQEARAAEVGGGREEPDGGATAAAAARGRPRMHPLHRQRHLMSPGRLQVLKLILGFPRGICLDVCAPGGMGDRPLHLAARGLFVGAVALLLRHGARVEERNAEGETPLQVAVESGRLWEASGGTAVARDVVRLLLDADATVPPELRGDPSVNGM